MSGRPASMSSARSFATSAARSAGGWGRRLLPAATRNPRALRCAITASRPVASRSAELCTRATDHSMAREASASSFNCFLATWIMPSSRARVSLRGIADAHQLDVGVVLLEMAAHQSDGGPIAAPELDHQCTLFFICHLVVYPFPEFQIFERPHAFLYRREEALAFFGAPLDQHPLATIISIDEHANALLTRRDGAYL